MQYIDVQNKPWNSKSRRNTLQCEATAGDYSGCFPKLHKSMEMQFHIVQGAYAESQCCTSLLTSCAERTQTDLLTKDLFIYLLKKKDVNGWILDLDAVDFASNSNKN